MDAPGTLTDWPESDCTLDQIPIEELLLVKLTRLHLDFLGREVLADAVEDSTRKVPHVVARGARLETVVASLDWVDQLALLSVDRGDTESETVEPANQHHSATLRPRWGCLHRGTS